jgi:hypothetical protein
MTYYISSLHNEDVLVSQGQAVYSTVFIIYENIPRQIPNISDNFLKNVFIKAFKTVRNIF